jgi:TorA maturation chaperone TorD
MRQKDFAKAAARGNLCRLLAACYYEPGPEFAEEKIFDSMVEAATRIRADLAAHARRLGQEFSAEGPDSLLVDYARLFLGPSRPLAAPYGSVWLEEEKTLMGDSTIAVQELYHEVGFEIDEDFRELPDHIAVELEFLYLLIYRENEARRNNSPEALTAIAGLRKRFLDEHLGSWVVPFTTAVKADAQSGFYRELAELTDRFVKIEADENKAA